MSKTSSKKTALAMVGSSVFHQGEHGTIERYFDCYDVPMLGVRFGTRLAILRPAEIGRS